MQKLFNKEKPLNFNDSMINFYHRQPFITNDGSSSLRLDDINEQFHSVHGAIQEALHIYIYNGLDRFSETSTLRILEMGFGTGLNALLTLIHQKKRTVYYHALEAYPLTLKEVENLNYGKLFHEKYLQPFLRMHNNNNIQTEILSNFYFEKTTQTLQTTSLKRNFYDLIYFDAFSPKVQPELWRTEIAKKILTSMKTNAILVTYCAKGTVKRSMKEAGFEVKTVSGPLGKREMTCGIKK